MAQEIKTYMKDVLHVSYSKSGGAGKVAQTLSKNQNKLFDYKSNFIYRVDKDLWNDPTQDVRTSVMAAFDNYLVKKSSFYPLFSLYREKTDSKFNEVTLNHKGIIHFHWMNGLIDFEKLLTSHLLETPLIWTIHDMNPITGGCHHSLGCIGYEKSCENCPAVKTLFTEKVVEMKAIRNEYFRKKEKIRIVVPSNWLAEKINASHTIDAKKVEVIPNPVDPMFFQNKNKNEIRKELELPKDAFIIGFVSQNLANPLKNFQHLIKLLSNAQSKIRKEIIVLAIGKSGRDFKNTKLKLISTGTINDMTRLIHNYAAIDLMVSSSLAETFGLSIAEAAALGIPSLVISGTATAEVVIDSKTGFIAKDDNEFIQRVIEMAEDENMMISLGENAKINARNNFEIKNVLQQYNKIYEKL